jgi:hypothetical protein
VWKWWKAKRESHRQNLIVTTTSTPPILAEALRRRLSMPEDGARLSSTRTRAWERVVEALMIKAMGGDVDAIRLVFELDREGIEKPPVDQRQQ